MKITLAYLAYDIVQSFIELFVLLEIALVKLSYGFVVNDLRVNLFQFVEALQTSAIVATENLEK